MYLPKLICVTGRSPSWNFSIWKYGHHDFSPQPCLHTPVRILASCHFISHLTSSDMNVLEKCSCFFFSKMQPYTSLGTYFEPFLSQSILLSMINLKSSLSILIATLLSPFNNSSQYIFQFLLLCFHSFFLYMNGISPIVVWKNVLPMIRRASFKQVGCIKILPPFEILVFLS